MAVGPDPLPNIYGFHPQTSDGTAPTVITANPGDVGTAGTGTITETSAARANIDAKITGLAKTMTVKDAIYRTWPLGP